MELALAKPLPHHLLTRQALYDRIWAEPMRTVAATLGVSDVGLAKACRAADIPTPPRGWWAKLHHGRPLPPKPSLPARPDRRDRVVIAPSRPRTLPSLAPATTAPDISEADPVPVPGDLRGAHAIVRAWVAENALRRREHRRNGWGLDTIEDLSLPLAQRRLRQVSALLKALERRKLTVGRGRDGLTATRNGETITFTLYERSRIEHRPATAEELRWRPDRTRVRVTVPVGDLVLKIRDWLSVPTEFRELKTPLETQLPSIVASVETGLVELAQARRQRALEKERWETDDRARRERKAYDEAWSALRDRLLAQAERRQRAEAIRAYVVAADASPAASAEDYAGWRTWALGEADGMDPLQDGSAPFARLPPLDDWLWRGW